MAQIVIAHQFHGPANSGNGGYVCGRLAAYLGGVCKVRLRVPPPLDVAMDVEEAPSGLRLVHEVRLIAECQAAELHLDVPEPVGAEEAEAASQRYRGFVSHRFPSCFVCGPERKSGEGLRIFAGPVSGRNLVACTWIPDGALSRDGSSVASEFVWAALDCPGGFAFPDPEDGKVVLGELTAQIDAPILVGTRYVVVGWEISQDGRKHHTGTALLNESGSCCARAKATWIEVTGPLT